MTGEHHKKVMILYASYGDGHYQVSKALREKFLEKGIREIVMIDLFKEANPTVNAITRYFYIKSYKVLPSVYGWLYYGTKNIKWDSFFAKWVQSYGQHKLLKMIKIERPDIVIHTFPMAVIPEIRKKLGIYIPNVTVVTDFDLHRRWLHPEIDKYYVATEDLKAKIEKTGIPSERIVVSGIPIKPAFEQRLPEAEILEKYQLRQGRHTILIMAGSYGVMQGLGSMCERLAKHEEIQLIVVCGKNKHLQDEMEQRFQSFANVRIMGFVEAIHELMQISTCIVTKPGGITLSEAISMQLPIFIYRPVPGQERDNAVYLESKGAACIAQEPPELEAQLLNLLNDPSRLQDMRSALSDLWKPHAADRIVDDIIADLNDHPMQRSIHLI